MEPRVRAPVLLCAVCQYPVRDPDADFDPDGDHSPCALVLDTMDDDLQRRREQRDAPAWAQPW